MSQPFSRAEAWSLLTEWVTSPSLRRHCLAVEAAMVGQARRRELPQADVERWALAGLLHDADYERHPEMDDEQSGHPRTILAQLRGRGVDEEVLDAIAGHAPYLGVPRETDMARALFAVDELAGFVVAVAQVRPEGLDGMTPKSVRKKLKTPAFAAAVSRDDVRQGAEELGLDLDVLVAEVIASLQARAGELELDRSADAAA